MKQGHASREGKYGGKVEPSAKAINKNWVSQMGNSVGNHVTHKSEPLSGVRADPYKGRGYEAPHDAGRTVHRSGSQGRS